MSETGRIFFGRKQYKEKNNGHSREIRWTAGCKIRRPHIGDGRPSFRDKRNVTTG